MLLTKDEQLKRHEAEFHVENADELNIEIPELDFDEIREKALAQFERELDGKLKNLQYGEHLVIRWRLDIINLGGKVRAGSGASRNMPQYIKWRTSVYERDDYTCQECGQIGGRLNAHHIKPWSKHPRLRFDVDNGVTLCFDCHAEKHPHLNFYD